MAAEQELQPIAPEEQLVWLVEGTGLSGKTTVTRTLDANGFQGIGRGHHLRGITSVFLEQQPGQIECYSPEDLALFLEDKADLVHDVLMGTYDPEYDRRSALINTFVPLVSETEAAQEVINGFTFDELGLMCARGVHAVAVEGRSLPGIFADAIDRGKFTGVIAGNTHLTVSREVAGDRAQRKAENEGDGTFDREEVLRRLDIRNETDRNRQRHPMVLDPEAYKIETPDYVGYKAEIVGELAVVDANEQGIPRCIHIHTDRIDEATMGRMMGSLVEGALRHL